MGGYGAYKAYSANKTNNAEPQKEIMMEDLTEEEQEEVKKLVEDYEFYLAEQERLKNNYMMNMDYNYTYYFLVSYYVDTEYVYNYLEVQENYASVLVSLYKSYMQSEAVNDIIMQSGIEGLDEVDLPYLKMIYNEGYIVKFGFFAEGTEGEKIVDEVCEAIEAYQSIATELVGEHKLVKTSYDVSIVLSESVRNGQSLRYSYLQQLYNEIEVNKTMLTAEQLNIYQTELGIEILTDVVQEETIKKSIIDIKLIIVGLILGVAIVTTGVIFSYVTGKTLKSVDEVKQVYGIELLGKIVTPEKGRKYVIRKLHKINCVEKDDQMTFVGNITLNKCKQDEVLEVVMCSTVNNSEKKLANIIEMLSRNNIKCKYVGNIIENVEAINAAFESKNVLIIEQINTTLKEDLENEIEICDKFSINILGMIVII